MGVAWWLDQVGARLTQLSIRIKVEAELANETLVVIVVYLLLDYEEV